MKVQWIGQFRNCLLTLVDQTYYYYTKHEWTSFIGNGTA